LGLQPTKYRFTLTMKTIFVTSANQLKISAVEKIANLTKTYDRVVSIDCSTATAAAQPVNDEIVTCARSRTAACLASKQFAEVRTSNSSDDDIVISIENGLLKQPNSRYMDVCCVHVTYCNVDKQKLQGDNFYLSDGIQLHDELAAEYFSLSHKEGKTLGFYHQGKTYGDFLSERYGVNAKDWMADSRFGNCKRSSQIEQALVKAIIDSAIKRIPDYPKTGVLFKDMNPIFENAGLTKLLLEQAQRLVANTTNGVSSNFDYVVGLQSRGYPLASLLAVQLGKPLILLRKLSSNPYRHNKESSATVGYSTEYSEDAFSLPLDLAYKGQTCLLVDDLVATGGSFVGAASVMQQAGMTVVACLSIFDVESLRVKCKDKMSELVNHVIVDTNNSQVSHIIKPLIGVKLNTVAELKQQPWLQVTELAVNSNVVMSASASSQPLTDAIADWLGLKPWKTITGAYASGETRARIVSPGDESVKNRSVVLVCSPSVGNMVAEFNQLIYLIDACKRSNCKQIIVVLPYYLSAREDKKDASGACIGSAVTAQLITGNRSFPIQLISLHLHAPQIQALIDNGFHNLSPKKLFGDFLRQNYLTDSSKDTVANSYNDKFFLVAPDAGALKLVSDYATYLAMDEPVFISKHRDPVSGKVDQMKLHAAEAKEYYAGKTAIIIDDMGDSFGTMFGGINFLMQCGVKDVIIIVTHALFTGDSISKLNHSPHIKAVICSNSLPQYSNIERCRKIIQVDMSKLFASAVSSCIHGQKLGSLFSIE